MKPRSVKLSNPIVGFLALCLSSPPAAAWDLQKSSDSASVAMVQDGVRLSLSCRRGPGKVSLQLTDVSGGYDLSAPLKAIQTTGALMLWIEQPDGRTSRDSFRGFDEQGSIAADIPSDHIRWDFFASGETLRVQDTTTTKTLFRSGMKGTGAARLAFQERCGI